MGNVTAHIRNRAELFHVQEVAVDALDLEGDAGLVDGGLGQGDEHRGQYPEEGGRNDGALCRRRMLHYSRRPPGAASSPAAYSRT
jgi:hypothetical protein